MRSRAHRMVAGMVLVVVVLAGLATACAKRPAMREVSAPPPTGAVTAAPPPAPAPPPVTAAPPAPTAPVPAPAAPAPAPAPAPPPAAVTPRPAPAEYAENPALADIHFDFDKSTIRPGDSRILDASATWLEKNPKARVLIEGHCDERGTNEYNLALGERRAEAGRAYLVSRGVAASRISIVSYGEERPACRERNEGCWRKNRRDHFLTKAE